MNANLRFVRFQRSLQHISIMKFSIVFSFCLYLALGIHAAEQKTSKTALNVIENANHSYKIYTEANTFKELLQHSEIFIDKTLLIKELLNSHEKAVALTRPAKWGKSVNLHMVKDFVEISLNTWGGVVNKTSTWSYKLFQRGEVTFDNGNVKKLKNPLLISKDEEIVKRNQGEYPVIYLTFKKLKWTGVAEEVRKDIEIMLSGIFIEHHYLLLLLQDDFEEYEEDVNKFEEKIRTVQDIRAFKKILYCLPVSAIELAQSVRLISRLLYHCYKKYVFIFIDDYDTPVAEILKQREFTLEEKNYLHFFQSFLDQSFSQNEFLVKGLVTGVLPIASRSYTTHGSIHGGLVDFYGFLDHEVAGLLEHYNYPAEQSKQLTEWYSGYGTDSNKNDNFFNPLSVTKFLNSNKIEDHWIKCENNRYIGKVLTSNPTIRSVIQKLIRKEKLPVIMFEKKGFTEESLKVMQALINPPYHFDANETVVNIFITFLLVKGHITVLPGTMRYYQVIVQIPNHEIIEEFRKHFISYYKTTYDFINSTLEHTASYLYLFMENDENTCENLRNSLENLWNFPSFNDIIPENSTSVSPIEKEFVNSINDAIALQIAVQHEPKDMEMIDTSAQNIIVYMKRLNRGVVVNFSYNDTSAIQILNQTQKHEKLLDKFDPSSMKYIVISITSNKTVDVIARIFRSNKGL